MAEQVAKKVASGASVDLCLWENEQPSLHLEETRLIPMIDSHGLSCREGRVFPHESAEGGT